MYELDFSLFFNFSPNLGDFGHYFFKCFFVIPLPLLFFSDSNYTCVMPFEVIPRLTDAQITCFFSSQCFILGSPITCVVSSLSVICPWCHPVYFPPVTLVFISRSSIWVFLIYSMSLLNMLHLSSCFLNTWNSFYHNSCYFFSYCGSYFAAALHALQFFIRCQTL